MNIVVIGAGLAGANAVGELREQGYTEDITLIGSEQHLPYERPPLSKSVLIGSAAADSVFIHDRQWYDDRQVELRLGTRVLDLDLDLNRVHLPDGPLAYDRLLLATGATPRRLAGLDTGTVETLYLRTLDDALALRSRLGGHILIVGAGWIGLEVASAARQAGAAVTVVENAALPLLGVLGPLLAAEFAELHREHGVDLRLDSEVVRVAGASVTLSDGHELSPDLIVVGIGAVAEQSLAADSGLATGNGVLVDAWLRASDPHVYAAGDVASHDHQQLGRLRVEHWDNAIEQGKHAARMMLGDDQPYARLPYFFTDQYDLGMEYVGHVDSRGYDEVIVRGDPEKRVITAFWTRENLVLAGMHINDWDAIDPIRRIVGRPADVRLSDPNTALADLGGSS